MYWCFNLFVLILITDLHIVTGDNQNMELQKIGDQKGLDQQEGDQENTHPAISEDSKIDSLRLSMRDSIVLFCGIALAAVIGGYTRVGVGYYRIWRTETNYVWQLIISLYYC